MVLIEIFENKIRNKNKVKTLTEKQLDKLFEFDVSAGFCGTRAECQNSRKSFSDKVAEERYSKAREAGYKGSLKQYKEKVLKR